MDTYIIYGERAIIYLINVVHMSYIIFSLDITTSPVAKICEARIAENNESTETNNNYDGIIIDRISKI